MSVKAPLKNVEGNTVGEVELSGEYFGVKPNKYAIHQVVRMQRAAARAGTASTKTRAEARGGGVKPWRQKGTGRARAGSCRSPIWKGGGVVFGPKPRDYSFRVPRKVRRLAFCSALSDAASDDRVTVLEDFALSTPSTSVAVEILGKLDMHGKIMVVVGEDDLNVEKSFRNLAHVETFLSSEVNTYDILRFDSLLLLKGALDKLQGERK
ncbi:MAG: 50S ribosomal protein L4 [Candidatus Anoxymicrobium japonicum]|uniref:Large ribosomal subunit protein uL4 n=1 Tax=Candidatus Anoxymicrobium japonicum TaxID=2013648 RepID=A0A2N3G5X5_9ACTN|nr:ribosomal protein L4 [uncultured bacterium]PKQ28111.1 MAG: 50S ribosomal protein L4 [Candidatus Anoxymicrobium japonicum]